MPTIEDKLREILGFGQRQGNPTDDEADYADAVPAEEFAAKEAEAEALRAKLAEAEAKLQAAADAEAAAASAAHRESVERWGQEMRASFKLTPAAADIAEALAVEHPGAFAALREVFAANPAVQSLTGKTVDADTARSEGGNADTERLHNLALARAEETGERYAAALINVAREHPELARAASSASPTVTETEE